VDVLVDNEQAYARFQDRNDKEQVNRANLQQYQGNCYLGIDAGSTTTKLILLSENDEILADYYAQNQGNPLKVLVGFLKDLYAKLPSKTAIIHSAVTGYGEALIQSAFGVDGGEVETVAHFTAATHFDPEVEFLLNIGGRT